VIFSPLWEIEAMVNSKKDREATLTVFSLSLELRMGVGVGEKFLEGD
jgi:hypothetical protein